ncbi:MAG TPA: trypsin-like peptidase domain-containing protein [Propionibacteriaceae bacterium]|nr:trypsin-like peptidase domain-containing protein [Propionibacteriaceae bacterium]
MAADDRRDDGDRGDQYGSDSRYYGPFGSPPPRGGGDDAATPLGIGRWSYGDDERTAQLPVGPQPSQERTEPLPMQPYPPDQGRPQAAPPHAGALFPAPAGVKPLHPRPPEYLAPWPGQPAPRRRRGGIGLLLLAGLTALVVGGAAGFGGSRLAAQSEVAPQTSAAPPAPSLSTAPSAPASPYTPPAGQPNTVGVAKTVLPSTVMIQVGGGTGSGTGSGFVLNRQGLIMTNNHVISAAADSGRIRVMFADGTRKTAELVGRSPSYDLAVIKVDPSPGLVPLRIGDSEASQVGESVIAVGSPLGLPGTVTAGIVSAKNRPVVVSNSENADAASAYINAIQTDAPINPGNSGGPLIDSAARVIGVNSAILTLGANRGQSGSIGLGFAIPINQAMEIGQQLIKSGKATYPVIGANVSDDAAEEGVQLSGVDASGPAAEAGLRVDDVVTSIDRTRVSTAQELIVLIRTHRPGDRVRLGYQRAGVDRQAVVILGGKEG